MQIKEIKIIGKLTEEQVKELEAFFENHDDNSLWATVEFMFGFGNFRETLSLFNEVLMTINEEEKLIGVKSIITMDTNQDQGTDELILKFFDKEPEMNTEFLD